MNKRPIVNQYHPPFVNAMHITLMQDEKNLSIRPEYSIQSLPNRVDILIVKKNPKLPLHKSIGHIFKKYNLIEYKPQGDSLDIDDFYYMLGNAYLLKARKAAPVSIEDISITFVSYSYPRELFNYLQSGIYKIRETSPGIYRVFGEPLAIQIVVLRRVDPEEYLWLSCLHKGLTRQEQDRLVEDYSLHSQEQLYRDVMNFIATINRSAFERRNDMCQVFMDIVRPQIELEKRNSHDRGKSEGKAEAILDLLDILGNIPAEVRKKIMSETNIAVLRDWLHKAARASSIEEFTEEM